MPRLRRSDPAYVQIAAYLRTMILSGQLKADDKLPSVAILAREFDVWPGTAHLAIKMLIDEGLVRAEPRRGSYVQPRSQ